MDLWKIDTKKTVFLSKELPNNILKEQAEILEEITKGAVYGRITNLKFDGRKVGTEYTLASIFEIVVPALDNYSYTLLILYSRPECDYPVAITVGNDIVSDSENFKPAYECRTRGEFIDALKEILSMNEVNEKIQTLLAKAIY